MYGKIIIVSLLFLFLIVPSISAQNYYQVDIWRSKITGSPVTITLPPAYSEYGTSSVSLDPYVNISAGTNLITSYYSPYGTQIASSDITPTGTIECLSLGSASTSTKGGNNTHEIQFTGTYAGTLNNFFGKYDFIVSTDQDYVNISNRIEDTNNYVPFTYLYHECDTSPFDVPFYDYFDYTNYGLCRTNTFNLNETTKSKGFNCIASNNVLQYYFPFNTSSGTIHYSLKANVTNCNTPSRWRLYPLDNSSAITTICDSDSVCSGTWNLPENEIWVISQYWDFCGAGGLTFYAPEINLSVFVYKPAWVCGDWSDCVDGYEHRVCTDPLGKVPDRLEYRVCVPVELQNLTLGFEDYYTETDVMVCIPTSFTSCTASDVSINVDRPLNWSIVETANKQYFLSMTEDWASEGSRSLKMWYIPPAENEIKATGVGCIDLDQGRFPQIYRGINDSFFISQNITFPASNMALSFDIVRCPENVQSYGQRATLFGIVNCPEKCYGNCSEYPLGKYLFDLIDIDNLRSVLPAGSYFDSAGIFPTSRYFDLSGLGLVPNKTYNVVFAVWPDSVNDNRGYCIMFDNVRYAVLRDPVSCVSECRNSEFWEANIVNGSCVFKITENSFNCLDSDEQDLVSECLPYCDGTTYYYPTDYCVPEQNADYNSIENYPLCIEEQEEQEEAETLTDPMNVTEIIETGELPEWAEALIYTPLMWIIIISLFISGLVAKFTRWEFGVVALVLVLIALGLLFPITFAWITIILIMVVGLSFAGFLIRHRAGG